MKAKCLAPLALAAVVLTLSSASAEVPQMINYQGRLTDSTGAPLDTSVSMRYRIYADPTTSAYLWTETHGSVTVEGGLFNVLLGSVTAIPDSAFRGSVRYLGIKVGSDSEMTPRGKLVSVAYAFHSESADTAEYAKAGASDGDWVIHGDTVHHHGHVGVGTSSPTADLHVSGALADVQTDGLAIENTGTGGRKYILGVSHNGWGLGGGKFFLYDVNAGGMAYRLLVDNQGRVGIGQSAPSYDLDVSGDIRATGTIHGNVEKVGGVYGGKFNSGADYAILVRCSDVLLMQNGATNKFKVQSTAPDYSGHYMHYDRGQLVSCGRLAPGGSYSFTMGDPDHHEVILARPWAGGVMARVDLFYENGKCGGIWTSSGNQ